MSNKQLLEELNKLPNRYNIMTKYGTFQNAKVTLKHFVDTQAKFGHEVWVRELLEYLISNWKEFKIKK